MHKKVLVLTRFLHDAIGQAADDLAQYDVVFEYTNEVGYFLGQLLDIRPDLVILDFKNCRQLDDPRLLKLIFESVKCKLIVISDTRSHLLDEFKGKIDFNFGSTATYGPLREAIDRCIAFN